MSSIIAVNSSEGESILPEVEELSQFHPDQLSSIVDIQKELEILEASENDADKDIMSMSTVDDVNVVDHEVTIVADQITEELTILPEIAEMGHQPEHFNENNVSDRYCNPIIEENLDVGETITIGTPNLCEPRLDGRPNNVSFEAEKSSPVSIKSTLPITIVQSSIGMPPLKAIRPLPDALKVKKPIMTMAQPKKNVLTKVIFSPNNQPAPDAPIIFGEAGGQTIRIVSQGKTIVPNSPKTITLAQAREMGLLSPGKVQHILPSQPKGIIKKGIMMNANKTLTVVKTSPTKILPLPTAKIPIAPSPTMNTLQKIFIRQTPSTIKSGTSSGSIVASSSSGTQGHILQIPVSQDNSSNQQIHQIQLPGKQVQYVRLVSSVSTGVVTAVSSTGPIETLNKSEPLLITSANSSIQRPVPVALSTSVAKTPQVKIMPIAPAQTIPSPVPQNTSSFERVLVSPGLSQLTARPDAKPPTSNIVMVPAEYVKQYKPVTLNQSPPSPPKQPVSTQLAVPPPLPPPLLTKIKEPLSNKDSVSLQPTQKSKSSADPPNGIRPRKPCNCTKSQCLKLYCDCFANGEFCYQCNCNSCFNNLDHEEERQRAIKSCLERNPNAFRPKIGKGYIGDERRHNKGCNCKRSGCLKNYCECYEAKIPCSNNCKCVGCRNVEEVKEKCISEGGRANHQIAVKNKLSSEIEESAFKPHNFLSNQSLRQPFNLMTQEVVEATCQCLLAQVEGEGPLTEHVERLILEEFGRCLVEIIDCATRTTVNNAT